MGVRIMVALYNTQEQAGSIFTVPLKTDIDNFYVPSEKLPYP